MVYALIVERIVSDVQSVRQAVLVSRVFGGKADPPSVDEQVEAFEASLIAEPRRFDPEDLELREALGLRGHRG